MSGCPDLFKNTAERLADHTGEPQVVIELNDYYMVIPESECTIPAINRLHKAIPKSFDVEVYNGVRARRHGKHADDCPYGEDEPRMRQAWLYGWDKEDRKRGYK